MVPIELCIDWGKDVGLTRKTVVSTAGGKKTVAELFLVTFPDDLAKIATGLLQCSRSICALYFKTGLDTQSKIFVVRAEKTTPDPENIDVYPVSAATFYSSVGANNMELSLETDIRELGALLVTAVDNPTTITARLVFKLEHWACKSIDFGTLESLTTKEFILADLNDVNAPNPKDLAHPIRSASFKTRSASNQERDLGDCLQRAPADAPFTASVSTRPLATVKMTSAPATTPPLIPIELCIDSGTGLVRIAKKTAFSTTGGKKTISELFLDTFLDVRDRAKISLGCFKDGNDVPCFETI